MKEIKLRIHEILTLEAEINGLVNQEGARVFTGLLSLKLPLVTKYWINELAETVNKEKKKIDELRTELIKKHGTEGADGSIKIEKMIGENKDEVNPAYTEFQNEYTSLLEEEKTISYNPIGLNLLEKVDSDGSENYPMFFKFVQP